MGAVTTGAAHYNRAPMVAHALRGEGFDASEDNTGRGTPLVPVAVDHYNGALTGDVAATLSTGGATTTGSGPSVMVPVAFTQNQRDEVREVGVAGALAAEPGMKQQTFLATAVALRGREGGATAELGDSKAYALRASSGGGDKPHVMTAMQVRRLTPRECERLQGFPDDYTQIPWRGRPASECPDGPRYRALGNSMAVPVMRYRGERIKAVVGDR